jgi:hypothetical protein
MSCALDCSLFHSCELVPNGHSLQHTPVDCRCRCVTHVHSIRSDRIGRCLSYKEKWLSRELNLVCFASQLEDFTFMPAVPLAGLTFGLGSWTITSPSWFLDWAPSRSPQPFLPSFCWIPLQVEVALVIAIHYKPVADAVLLLPFEAVPIHPLE